MQTRELEHEQSLREDYFLQRSLETLRIGKIASIAALGILAYDMYQDWYLLKLPQLLPWRLVAFIPIVVFLIGAFTIFVSRIRWVIICYSIILCCVMIMIFGTTLTILNLETVPYMYKVGVTGGITVTVIGVFIASAGTKRYLPYIIGIPVVTLFVAIVIQDLLTPDELTLLVNPAIVATLTIILSFVQEKLHYRSFLSLHVAEQRREKLEREISLREQLQEELRQQAMVDDLTGQYNRRALFDILHTFIKLAERDDILLSLCFIDIDGLKRVNDEYGHSEGDNLIRSLVTVIAEQIRSTDTMGRLGGDEFLVIFPNRSLEEARYIMERVERSITEKNARQETPYKLSLSYGLVEYDHHTLNTSDALIQEADTRMYEHKLKKHKKRL